MAKVDSARKWSDKKLKKMEAEISDIYGSATKEISEKWVAYMERTNQKISKYQQAYDDAVKGKDADSISKAWDELVKAKTSQTLGNEYYQNMVNDTTTKMAEVNQIALAYANNQMPSVYAFNYNFADSDMQKLITNTGVDFSLADEATVKRRILDGDIKLPKKKVDIPKDKRWNTKQLNSSVLQGIIQGESMKDIAKRILPIVSNNEKAAIRNTRTMMTGAECQGRVDRYKNLEEQGVVMKKVWMATGDNRTRDWHLEMDGQERDIDEDFEDGLGNLIQYPGDPSAEPETVYNCRCAIKSHIIGFRRADGSISYINESEADAESFHNAEIEAERERRAGESSDDNSNPQNLDELTAGLMTSRPNKADYDTDEAYSEAREQYREDKATATDIVSNWFDENIANNGITDSELSEWADQHNVKLVGDFDGMDRQALRAYTERFDQLSEEFPLVQEWQGYFGIPFEVGFDASMMYDAEASHGMMFGAPYSNYKDLTLSHFFAHGRGDFVAGENPAVCTFDHEWGHNVYFAMTQYGFHSEDRDYERIAEIKKDVLALVDLKGISDYATVNDDELFAEAFAAWHGKEDTDFARGMGELLIKWGVVK